jgi:hypothetical protein
MTMHHILKRTVFGPEEIRDLVAAYDQVLRKLRLAERSDPFTELIAKKIVELGQRGVSDPAQLTQPALNELNIDDQHSRPRKRRAQ